MKKGKPRQLTALMGEGVIPSGSLVVSADDLGLTRGDGCFEAIRVVTFDDGISQADHLDEHLARMDRSARALGGEPLDLDAWRELADEAMQGWANPGESVLKLIWTLGRESVASEGVGIATITPMSEAMIEQRSGIRVCTLSRGVACDAFADAPWLLGGVKSLSYALNRAAAREAVRRGFDDVLFVSTDGHCLEAPTSGLVALIDQTLVTTPTGATGILDSITVRALFERAQAKHVPVEHRLMTVDDLHRAQGVWLLNSGRLAAPVLELDGRPLELSEKWNKRVQKWVLG